MTNKKIISILALFLVLFVAVGAVSAADDIAVNDVNDKSDMGVAVLNDGGSGQVNGTFADLKSIIDNSTVGSTIVLDKNYVYSDSDIVLDENGININVEGIAVNNALTIDGNGFTIDGSNVSRIFQVGNNIVLKNINFKNANQDYAGAAIYAGGTITNFNLINCTFTNCNGKGNGIVYLNKGTGFNLNNCKFTNCNVVGRGGAIYIGTATNCNFNCSDFINCTCDPIYTTSRYGGAIYISTATNCNFTNCNFMNCSAPRGGGGAIDISSATDCTLTDCMFTNCNSIGTTANGGAINFDEAINTISITKSTFINCEATNKGGAIYIASPYKKSLDFTLNNCIFEDCNANSGKALYYSTATMSTLTTNLNDNFWGANFDEFELGLIVGDGANKTPDNWVKVKFDDESNAVKFVLNNGSDLTGTMPDYEVDMAVKYVNGTTDTVTKTFVDNKFAIDNDVVSFTVSTKSGNELVSGKLPLDIVYISNEGLDTDDGTITSPVLTLAHALEIVKNNGKIIFMGDDTYILSDVKVNKTVTITTNGKAVLSGNNANRILTIKVDGVVIKDLTFKDGNHNGNGAAIDVYGATTISGCNFTNNHVNLNGGAINFQTGSKCTVENCIFTNNRADASAGGGAIYSYAVELDIINSTFKNNYAGSAGSAIYSVNSITIDGCLFDSNEASYGSAIMLEYESGTPCAVIKNTNFTNNKASDGAALFINGGNESSITNCLFEDNIGGRATVFIGLTPKKITVTDCVFNHNKCTQANAYRCVLLARGLECTIIGCNFTNNEANAGDAKATAGILCWAKNQLIKDCNFVNCTGSDVGSAILADEINITIDGCNFINCSAVNKGGAIYVDADDNNVKVINSVFDGCSAANGGAIYIERPMEITGSNFTNNTAKTGGAIYITEGASLKADNVKFINNTVTPPKTDGHIPSGAGICSYGNLLLDNCVFDSNKVNWTGNTAGGAIYQGNTGEYCNITNCNFTNNKPCPELYNNNEEIGCVYGGAVYIASDYLIDNCIFDNNTGRWGVVLLVNNEGIINNTLINNSYVYQGNLYLENSNAKVYNTNITNSKAELHGSLDGSKYLKSAGSAVMILGTVKALFENCNIVNNTDKGNNQWNLGGTFYISSGSVVNVIIKDSSFKDNSAIKGGAIWLETLSKGNVTINNTLFDNNKATAGSGGAIYSASCKLNINDCTFENNEATTINTGLGGAIYYATSEPLTINNCNFINCLAGNDGGALDIYSSGSTVNINACNFTGCNNVILNNGIITLKDSIIKDSISSSYIISNTNILNLNNVTVKNNSATNVIWSNGNQITINNSNIANNTVSGDGTVYIYDGIFTVTDSTFKKNTVSGNGGALYLYKGSGKITGSDFIDNSAKIGGAIYSSADLEISNSKFINNNAEYGSAIYNEPSVVYGKLISQSETVKINVPPVKYYRNTTYGISEISGITISNCQFSNNDASVSGTIYTNNTVEPVNAIVELRVRPNGDPWGSLELRNSYYSEETQSCGATVSISDSEFDKNIARNGAIVVGNYATFVFEGNNFTNNSAKNAVVISATGKTSGVQLTIRNNEFIANDKAPVTKFLVANGNIVNALIESEVDSSVSGNIIKDNENKAIFHNNGATADFSGDANIVENNGVMKEGSLDGYIENDGIIVGGTTELIDKYVAVVVNVDGTVSNKVGFVGRLATKKGGIVINDNEVKKLDLSCAGKDNHYTLNDAEITDETESGFASYSVKDQDFHPIEGKTEPYVTTLSVNEEESSSNYEPDSGKIYATGGTLKELKTVIDSVPENGTLYVTGNYKYVDGDSTIQITRNINIVSLNENNISAGELGTLFVVGDNVNFGLSDLTVVAKNGSIAIDMAKNTNNSVVINNVTFDGEGIIVVNLGNSSNLTANDCVAPNSYINYVAGANIVNPVVVIGVTEEANKVYDLTANVTVGDIDVNGLGFRFTATQNGTEPLGYAIAKEGTNGVYELNGTNFAGLTGKIIVSVDLANADVVTAEVNRVPVIMVEKDYNVTKGDVVPVVVIVDGYTNQGMVHLWVASLDLYYNVTFKEMECNVTDGKYYYTFNVPTSTSFPGKEAPLVAKLSTVVNGETVYVAEDSTKSIFLNDPRPAIDNVTVNGKYDDLVNITFNIINDTYVLPGDKIVLHLLNGTSLTVTIGVDGQNNVTFENVLLPFYSNGQPTEALYIRDGVVFGTAVVTWNIAKIDSNVTFNVTNITSKPDVVETVLITVLDANGKVVKQGNITVSGEGIILDKTVYELDNGKAIVSFKCNASGEYSLKVSYDGGVATNNTGNYNPSNASLNFNVTKNATSVIVENVTVDVGVNVTVNVTVDGVRKAGSKVNITITDDTGSVVSELVDVDEFGHASVSFVPEKAGIYNIVANYLGLEGVYESSSGNGTVIVNNASIIKQHLIISVDDISGKPGETVLVPVHVVTEDGVPVSDIIVEVTLPNGKVIKVLIIDGVGYFNMTLPKVPGKYSILVSFEGNDYYYPANSTGNLNVTVKDTKHQHQKGIPMEHTGIPILALLLVLLSIPLVRFRKN